MQRYLRTLQDTDKLKKLVESNRETLKFWVPFAVIALILFWLFSDWDFSLFMTTSSLTSMFAFLMVCLKMETNRSAKGVSLKMFECYLLLVTCRLCSIIPFEGYLPYDRSGDWLYQTVEVISLFLVGLIVFMCRKRFAASYEADADVFKHHYMVIGCLVLALLFHPSLNSFMPADICWTFALYLESVAVLPQLFMFHREKRVEPFTTHFLAGQAASRLFSFIFWFSSYKELNDPTKTLKSYVGQWVMIMQLLQLVVMGDFIYHYIQCINNSAAFHVDSKPILDLYRAVVNLQLKLAKHEGLLPADRIADVDSILKKSDEFIRRLDASPYISELPFRLKAKIFEPMIDMRVAAINLKRALKPCLIAPKKPVNIVPALILKPFPNPQVLGRGFL